MGTTLGSTGVTFPDATVQTTASSYIGGRGQVFTASGTFTVPSGITTLKVTVLGGGGAGGAGQSIDPGERGLGGGGAGGGAAIKFITGLVPGTGIAVTISGTGAGASFGSYCSATAGAAGSFGKARNIVAGSTGGMGASGDLNIRGPQGGASVSSGVGAGAALFSTGGGNWNQAAQFNGAGGGGGTNTTFWVQTGGAAGSAGMVIVEW